MGASFEQIECKLSSEQGILNLRRYSSDITRGILSLYSYEEIEKVKQEMQNKKSDI